MEYDRDAPFNALLRAMERTADAVGDGATIEDARVIDTLVSAYTRLRLVRSMPESHRPPDDAPEASADHFIRREHRPELGFGS